MSDLIVEVADITPYYNERNVLFYTITELLYEKISVDGTRLVVVRITVKQEQQPDRGYEMSERRKGRLIIHTLYRGEKE